jgi:hypothetical protein
MWGARQCCSERQKPVAANQGMVWLCDLELGVPYSFSLLVGDLERLFKGGKK